MDAKQLAEKLFIDRVAAYVQANAAQNANAFPGAHVAKEWYPECLSLAEAYIEASSD